MILQLFRSLGQTQISGGFQDSGKPQSSRTILESFDPAGTPILIYSYVAISLLSAYPSLKQFIRLNGFGCADLHDQSYFWGADGKTCWPKYYQVDRLLCRQTTHCIKECVHSFAVKSLLFEQNVLSRGITDKYLNLRGHSTHAFFVVGTGKAAFNTVGDHVPCQCRSGEHRLA